MLTHPYVAECGAVGRKHEMLGEEPCCFVSLKINPSTGEKYSLNERELQEYLSKNVMAEYRIPETVLVLDELPKGKTGKIDRKLMKQWINASQN